MSLPLYMIVNRTLPLWEWNPNLCITKDNAVLIMPAKFLYERQITLYGPRVGVCPTARHIHQVEEGGVASRYRKETSHLRCILHIALATKFVWSYQHSVGDVINIMLTT